MATEEFAFPTIKIRACDASVTMDIQENLVVSLELVNYGHKQHNPTLFQSTGIFLI